MSDGPDTFSPPTSLEAAVEGLRLQPLADALGGDAFAVCDLTVHGVAGCAAMREALHTQHLFADLATLGIVLLVAALTGGIAVLFVKMMGAALHFMRRTAPRQAVGAGSLAQSTSIFLSPFKHR